LLNDHLYTNSKIMVIDDDYQNALLVSRLLEWSGYQRIEVVSEPLQALDRFKAFLPDLVLLDLHMPRMSGIELMREFKQCVGSSLVPLLVFSGDTTQEAKQAALREGASDFLTKPGDANEILLRVKNFLQMRHLHSKLQQQNEELEARVFERTKDLVETQVEVVDRLARAAEFRDDETGEHTRRVGELSAEIGELLGLARHEIVLLRRAAPLHDLGKIGIPDSILLKAGPLTKEEFEIMKTHTTIGGRILSGGNSAVMQMAEQIALSHHERWDGSGYPQGLAGEAIPLPGRIVAVADVFDALTHARPYKEAWPIDKAVAEIERCSGTHFDPAVVAAFLRVGMRQVENRAA
jgi:putative two-component system response regulator